MNSSVTDQQKSWTGIHKHGNKAQLLSHDLSFDPMNADCDLSHWIQKPDVIG